MWELKVKDAHIIIIVSDFRPGYISYVSIEGNSKQTNGLVNRLGSRRNLFIHIASFVSFLLFYFMFKKKK